MNIGAAISSRLDLETKINESINIMNQCTPGWRTRAYSPVVISLSPTPVVIYVLRKGRLINREYINKNRDIGSSPQPNQVNQIGSGRVFDLRHSMISE